MAKAPAKRSTKRLSGGRSSRRFSQPSPRPTPNPRANWSRPTPSPCWSPWCCRRRRPMPGSTRRRRRCSSWPTRRQKMVELGVERITELVKTIGLLPQQGQERLRAEPDPRRAVRRRGAGGPRGAGIAARRRAEDRQCGAQHRLRAADHRGRHASVPRRQPHRAGAGQGRRSRSSSALLKVVPEQYLLHAHHWLILHGRYVCKARKPECYRCIIAEWCRFEPKTPPPKDWDGGAGKAERLGPARLRCAGDPRYLRARQQDDGRPMADTQFDVLTIGNAIVDVIAPIDPEFLDARGHGRGHHASRRCRALGLSL